MKLNETKIKDLATRDRLAFKKHTVLRMHQQSICADEVKYVLQNCRMIEEYPDDSPLPSALVFGYTKTKRPIHAVLALDDEYDMLWIITVYEPNCLEWDNNYEKRRS